MNRYIHKGALCEKKPKSSDCNLGVENPVIFFMLHCTLSSVLASSDRKKVSAAYEGI